MVILAFVLLYFLTFINAFDIKVRNDRNKMDCETQKLILHFLPEDCVNIIDSYILQSYFEKRYLGFLWHINHLLYREDARRLCPGGPEIIISPFVHIETEYRMSLYYNCKYEPDVEDVFSEKFMRNMNYRCRNHRWNILEGNQIDTSGRLLTRSYILHFYDDLFYLSLSACIMRMAFSKSL